MAAAKPRRDVQARGTGDDVLNGPSLGQGSSPVSLLSLKDKKGAYLLVIELDAPTCVAFRGRRARLGKGRYAYCGSAYGPGGLSARLSRHLRAEKNKRWHIDWLTEAGRIVGVYALPGGSECVLRSQVSDLSNNGIPLPGFGSSDCRSCPAHLVQLTDDAQVRIDGLLSVELP